MHGPGSNLNQSGAHAYFRYFLLGSPRRAEIPQNRDFTYFRYKAYRADPNTCPLSIFSLFYIPAITAALFYMVFEISELSRILYTIWEK